MVDRFIPLPPANGRTFVAPPQSSVIDEFLNSISGHHVLSRDEEQRLFRRMIDAKNSGNTRQHERLKNMICKHNGRLAIAVCKKYFAIAGRFGIPMEDILQESLIGLSKAIDKFDPDMGNKFSTMAIWWMRQQITRAIHDGDIIRKPVYYCEKYSKISQHVKRLYSELRRQPTPQEICDSLYTDPVAVKKFVNRDNPEITPELILEVFAKFQRTSSLNFAIEGDKDKTEIIDLIPDDHGVSPDLAVEQQDTKEALMSCLRDRLSERELEIISLRHGLKGNRPLKLLEVGKIYGLSREGVRKIQTGAERKLNSNSFKNRVRSLLDVS